MGDLISVIVPVYNAEKYIDDCIRSITEQTYKELQIILIDDGSTDTSGSRLDDWCRKDARIEVIHKDNEGVSAARNLGMELARGRWISFVDADDWLATTYLSDLMRGAIESNDCEIIISGCTVVYEKGVNSRIDDSYLEFGVYGKISKKDYYQELANLKIWTCSVWGKLFLKSILTNSFVSQAFAEDIYYLWEVMNQKLNIYITEDDGYFYRLNNQSVTHDKLRLCEKQRCTVKVFNQIRNKCYEENINTNFLEWNILWQWLSLYVGDINTQNVIKTLVNIVCGKYCGGHESKNVLNDVYQNVNTYSRDWIKSRVFIHEVKRLGKRLYKM